MKKTILAALFLMLFPLLSLAASNPTAKSILKASPLSIKDLSLQSGFDASDGQITGSFSVEGTKDEGITLLYGLSLVTYQDVKNSEEQVVANLVSGNQTVTNLGEKIEFSFPWPQNIPSGSYDVKVSLYGSGGEILAFDSRKISRQKSGNYSQISGGFLTWNLEDKKSDGDILFGTTDHIYLGATVLAMSNDGKQGQAHIVVKKDNILGETVSDFNADAFTFKNEEKRFVLVKNQLAKGTYFASLQLVGENGEPISNILNYSLMVEDGYTNNKTFSDAFHSPQEDIDTAGSAAEQPALAEADPEKNQRLLEAIHNSVRKKAIMQIVGWAISLILLVVVAFLAFRYYKSKKANLLLLVFLLVAGFFLLAPLESQAGTASFCIKSDLSYYVNGYQSASNAGIAGTISSNLIPASCLSVSNLPDGTYTGLGWKVTGNNIPKSYAGNTIYLKFSEGTMNNATVPGTNTTKLTMRKATLTIIAEDALPPYQRIPNAVINFDGAKVQMDASGKVSSAIDPGIYLNVFLSADGYEDSTTQNIILSSDDNKTFTFRMNRKLGSIQVFAGIASGGTCDASSQGVPGATVSLRRLRDSNITTGSTSGTGWATFSGLESDLTKSTYEATVSAAGYRTPLKQNIIVDSISIKRYIFCLTPDVGSIGFAWTPPAGINIAPSGSIGFNAAVSSQLSTTHSLTLYFQLDSMVASPVDTKTISPGSTVNYSASLSYPNLSTGTHYISVWYSVDGSPKALFEQRAVNVISLSGVIKGRVTDCETTDPIQSQSSDEHPVYLNLDSFSAPINTDANGNYSYPGVIAGTYNNVFVSRYGFDPSIPKKNIVFFANISSTLDFCMKRQTGSLVAEFYYYSGIVKVPIRNETVTISGVDPATKKTFSLNVTTNVNGWIGGANIPVENYGSLTATWNGMNGTANPSPVRIFSNTTTVVEFALSAPTCIPNNCAANTCIGLTCWDGCIWANGTKSCACTPDTNCSSHPVTWTGICIGNCGEPGIEIGTCDNGCLGTGSTTRGCPTSPCPPPSSLWKEVAP